MALEKLLPGHGPPLLLPFPWDPALPFSLQELPRDAGNSLFPPGWLGAPALPTPAPENTAAAQGQEKPWGAILQGASPRERGSGVERDTLEESPSTLPALAGDNALLGECPSDQTSA